MVGDCRTSLCATLTLIEIKPVTFILLRMAERGLKSDRPISHLQSIVVRMRIAMALISFLVIGLIFVGIDGLDRIHSSQTTLTDQSIPGLVRVEVLEDRLQDLDSEIRQMLSAQSVETHHTHRDRAMSLIARLRDATAQEVSFSTLINDLEASTSIAASASEDIHGLKVNLTRLENQVLAAADSFVEHLEVLMLEKSIAIEVVALGDRTQQSDQSLREGLLTINALTGLGHLTERNLEQMFAALSANEQLVVAEASERIAFNFRTIIRHLAQLDDTSQRQMLAEQVRIARRLLLQEDGLIATERKLLDLSERRDTAMTAYRSSAQLISKEASIGVASARSNIWIAAASVRTSIETMMFRSRSIGIIVLVLIAAVAFFMVERTIIRRIKDLSTSIREIADGKNDALVTVRGNDELGEMSQALEVFKSNSRELQRSNAELGRFAYAASHDLMSPLRAIHDLAQWTLEDARETLSQDCRENLEMLLVRAKRLSGLHSDLLDYSRVGRKMASIGSVSIQDVFVENLELLGKDQAFSVELTGECGAVETYEAPLRQILMNLTSNAIKHHDRQTGVISVDCRMIGSRLEIAVSDDGPGIAPEYHDRVFGLFETLQSRDDVEGSGMGLAIIRKQVEQYGGEIKVTSDPKVRRGTTFTFDWPTETQPVARQLVA